MLAIQAFTYESLPTPRYTSEGSAIDLQLNPSIHVPPLLALSLYSHTQSLSQERWNVQANLSRFYDVSYGNVQHHDTQYRILARGRPYIRRSRLDATNDASHVKVHLKSILARN